VDETTSAIVESGRVALARRDWPGAQRCLSSVAPEELSPDDLEGLAVAAWAVDDTEGSIAARERAHAGFASSGDASGAAWTALFLAGDFFMRGDLAVAGGWRATAERYLADAPECPAHARAHFSDAYVSAHLGDLDGAVEQAERAREVARRVGSLDLEMLALQIEGHARAKRGELERGMAMMDEAMVAVTGDRLAPWAAMPISCFTITACQELADYGRAAEWIETCDRTMAGRGMEFSADCHVHRAGVLKLRGSLARAEAEARLACGGARPSRGDRWHAGWGWCEIGEIRLRLGDLEGADEAFTVAHEHGYPPHPGLALLRLAQGEARAAAIALEQALEEAGGDRLLRARLLEASVSVALAADEVASARRAADELAEIAEQFPCAALRAAASGADGAVQLATRDPGTAVGRLRAAVQEWSGLGMPYETARARLVLAEALGAAADDHGARLELRACRSTFADLGAELDRQRAERLLSELEAVSPDPAVGRSVERTFMFTDIERSTALAEVMGDAAWNDVLRWHDRALRECIREHDGRVVKHEGDGFFVAFEDTAPAVRCAVAIQQLLDGHRARQGFAPGVRIGVHQGPATERHGDYFGMAVNVAARVMSLAGAGEVLATALTAAGHDAASEPRTVRVKGVSQPFDVVTLHGR